MSIYRYGIKRLVIGALCIVCILQVGCLAPPILFPKQRIYGRIIDQHGDPVADAKLNVSWNGIRINYWAAPARNKRINTDEQGRFYFGIRKADDVSIGWFQKYGYVRFEERRHSFDIDDISSSKDDPFIVKLRKIGEPTFLLSQGNKYSSSFGRRFGIPFKLPFSVAGIDLLNWKETFDLAKGATNAPSDDFYVDLQVMARYAPESRIFNVTFKMPESEQGGFIYTNKSLFKAPEAGYKKESISFALSADYMTYPNMQSSQNGFFYVKSRNPTIYIKVRWRVEIASKFTKDIVPYSYKKRNDYYIENINLYYHAYINPYGERNFEPCEPLMGYRTGKRRAQEMIKLSNKLRKDAREALAKGELAEKPDLIKLLEEATAKHEIRRKKCQAREKERNRIIKEIK